MQKQKNERVKKDHQIIVMDETTVHDFIWERQKKKETKQKRSVSQYSMEYLTETLLLQKCNPFDYHLH